MGKSVLKHLDLFSGYGGFTISAQKQGWDIIGFSEIDKYASAVLEYNFNIKNYGNISDIDFRQFRGEVDIITGGTPCQDLSVAGKGKGLEGERSGLFFEFIRAITESEPTYFVWENVKGALSSSKGWDFARVQIEMEQAGYDVWWQLINAKDFGVPQNRERVFAIGIRKGSGREILFEQRESGKDINKIVDTGHDGTNIFDTDGTGVTLKANGGGQGAKTGLYAIYRGRPNMPYEKGKRTLRYERYDKECPALTQNCATGDQKNMVAIPNSNGNVHSLDANYWKGSNNPNKSRRSQVVVHNLQPRSPNRPSLLKNKNAGGSGHLQKDDGTTYTLDTGNTQGIEQGTRIRRLIPIETERLMGLEDNWTAKGIVDGKEVDISDTQRYKMCGNGVVVNCVDYIYNLITKTL